MPSLARGLHCTSNDSHTRQLVQSGKLSVIKKLLDATHLRHEALSNNLANVETPVLNAEIYLKNFQSNCVVLLIVRIFGVLKTSTQGA